MSQYMLLLYAETVDEEGQTAREAELPLFAELHKSLREAGLLVAVQPLRSVESATSIRVRDRETEIIDGPFAETKEHLVGYYILECADLDEALKQAARVPLARYGTIEVRPLLPHEEWIAQARRAGTDEEAVKHLV